MSHIVNGNSIFLSISMNTEKVLFSQSALEVGITVNSPVFIKHEAILCLLTYIFTRVLCRNYLPLAYTYKYL